MTKKLNEKEFIKENNENTGHDDSDNAEMATDDVVTMETLLEHAVNFFFFY